MQYIVRVDRIKISVMEDRYQVSGIITKPEDNKATLVLGHGAGAGMEHPFMEHLSMNLANFNIGTLRYNFPYMEQGKRSPTSPAISEATVRAAVNAAHELIPKQPLMVGGKSYGGRMSSQAQSKEPLPGVIGLVFFGFPLHAPGKPGDSRGAHLRDIKIPMLFLQGSRDKLADLDLLTPMLSSLGSGVNLKVIDGADHSFNMLKSAATTTEQVRMDLAGYTSEWLDSISK